MTDHTDIEVLGPQDVALVGLGRLINDSSLGMELFGKFFESQLLQYHQSRGEIEGTLRVRVSPNIAVEICPGEDDDQRSIGMKLMEFFNRFVTAPRMKAHHHITGFSTVVLIDRNLVAELA